MTIIETEDYSAMSLKAASIIFAHVVLKPSCVLGLATGSTPIGTYENLIRWNKDGQLSFADVRTVNLDEYCGLAPDHDQSYRYFMQSKLFDHVDIKPENTFVPNGLAPDMAEECRRYDGVIQSMGGIDLQLLGLGHNGHIAFNEPSDSFQRWTHVVSLKESTIQDNSRFFNTIEEVPTQALTMGIGSIMQAKRILIIALGEHKAKAIKQVISGNVTPECPASVLQFHTDVTLMLDRGAASLL